MDILKFQLHKGQLKIKKNNTGVPKTATQVGSFSKYQQTCLNYIIKGVASLRVRWVTTSLSAAHYLS